MSKRIGVGVAFTFGVLLVTGAVGAQQMVDQGKPGTKGAWPTFDALGSGLGSTVIAAGYIPGASVSLKFGRNPDVDTATTPEDLWGGGGLYTGFPLSPDGGALAGVLEVFSSSVNDTSVGTGARTITIEGLNEQYEPIAETVTLNGTTPVVTSAAFGRVNFAFVESVGAGGSNAGVITARHQATPANVFLHTPIGFNQCQCAGFTVPNGKRAFLVNYGLQMLGSGTSAIESALWARWPGTGVGRLLRPYNMTDGVQIEDEITGGIALPSRTDIIPRILSSNTNNVVVSGHMDFIVLSE